MFVENDAQEGVLHNTAICGMVREELRKHKVCDGSGHLYLSGIARPLTSEKIEIVVSDVFAAFQQRGINPNEELVRTQIWGILTSLVKRKRPPAPPKAPKVKKKQSGNNPRKPQTVIQKRRFHYPRDLRAFGGGDQ